MNQNKIFVVFFGAFLFLFTPVVFVSAKTAVLCSSSNPCKAITRNLGLGSAGADVSTLQRILSSISDVYPAKSDTGYFGKMTELAVQKFQSQYGLISDGTPATTGFGRVGPLTRTKLFSTLDAFIPTYKTVTIADSGQTNLMQFGYYGRVKVAQSFTAAYDYLSAISFGVSKVGKPTSSVTLALRETLTGPAIGSWTIPPSSISDSYNKPTWITQTFTFPKTLIPGKMYFVTFSSPSSGTGDYYSLPLAADVYPGGMMYDDRDIPANWYDAFIKFTYVSALPDVQAPTVPGGLIARPMSTNQISLVWNASADNVGVAGYKIWRDGILISTMSTGTKYPNSGLTASTTYKYNISAFDVAGNTSALSAPVSVTTFTGFEDAPFVNTTYRPESSLVIALSAVASTTSEIDLSWVFPPNTDIGVVNYKVWRDGVYLATVAGTSYNDTGLLPFTSYSYVVYAYDQNGYTGVKSDTESLKTLNFAPIVIDEIPSVPTQLTALPISSSAISLSWKASVDENAIAGYRVYRNGIQIATIPTGTKFTNMGLLPGVSYTYSVSSYDVDGNESAQSSGVSATTTKI